MIFAAGLGTRLKPLTDNMPKALVPVDGKPMLEHVILHLKEAGFDDITINIHYLGEQIIDFLRANNHFGVTIRISDELGEVLETGGGILKAKPLLCGDEPFLVHNADILTDVDLRSLYNRHLQSSADFTLLVGKRQTSRYLLFDQQMQLEGWLNKQTGELKPEGFMRQDSHEEFAFNGIHVMSPQVFKWMEEYHWSGKFSLIPFYLSICHEARIQAYPIQQECYWFDIGKMETLRQAEEHMKALYHGERS